MNKTRWLFLSLFVVFALLLAACSTSTQPATDQTADTAAQTETQDTSQPADEAPAETEAETETETEMAEDDSTLVSSSPSMAGRIPVRWYVGLGAGTDEATIKAQQEIVDEYNASQDRIELLLEIVDNDSAYDVLNTQIAAGNAPDIVGPMGIRGRASFPGAWLDMTPLIEKNNYDLSDFDSALVDFYRIEGEGQLGIPFAVFPSYMFVNLDLFDEAGLPYPPQEYGAPYVDENGEEKPWNIDTLGELALKLTVDANGNDATSDEFDPDNIVQFGFGPQWTDIRGRFTMFGAGNFVAEDGQTAQFPEDWLTAAKWYHNAYWTDFFVPNGVYGGSDILGAGNWFESGNMAMAHVHQWYAACCLGALNASWDTAVMPENYNGEAIAKLHADTFGILKSSKNVDAAFEVLTYLLGEKAGALAKIYGGMPARISLQDAYFDEISELTFGTTPGTEINWDVVRAGLSHPDNPNHEEGMPSFLEASDRYNQFGQLLENDPNMDIDAEAAKLVADLQKIFDAAQR